MSKSYSLFFLFCLFLSTANAFEMGVNIHSGGGSLSGNQQFADIMKARNLKTARLDFWLGMNLTGFRDQIQKIKANGGQAEVAMQISYQWDNSCNQNLQFVEQDSYNQAVTLVNQIKDLVQDFELLNETQLRPEILKDIPFNSAGTSPSAYEGKPCVDTLTAVLRGMSRAIRDIRVSSGVPLRTILGVVGRDFGFLTYMEQHGVLFDVTGYHIYPYEVHASLLSDPWFGTGGPLVQLAKFNRPVHINEFNCGEIYSSSYDNQAGSASTETCLRSIDKHLTDLKNQKIINLESVHVYELLDEPSKPMPENRFGLMYDLANPKVHLLLYSAFAGGSLTAAEQLQVTSRGLLSDTEIAGYRNVISPDPDPTPSDNSAPVVLITSPANNAVFVRAGRLTVTATATDNIAVTDVRFYLKGSLICTVIAAPYECRIKLSRKRQTYTLEAVARDAAGNLGRHLIYISGN